MALNKWENNRERATSTNYIGLEGGSTMMTNEFVKIREYSSADQLTGD